jgi:hypothetical protein
MDKALIFRGHVSRVSEGFHLEREPVAYFNNEITGKDLEVNIKTSEALTFQEQVEVIIRLVSPGEVRNITIEGCKATGR